MSFVDAREKVETVYWFEGRLLRSARNDRVEKRRSQRSTVIARVKPETVYWFEGRLLRSARNDNDKRRLQRSAVIAREKVETVYWFDERLLRSARNDRVEKRRLPRYARNDIIQSIPDTGPSIQDWYC
jgi:hypothetical protein